MFPEVEIPEEGRIAAQFCREFNRYLAKIGLKTGPETATYSLRHTFIDRARLAGIMDEEIATVVGHDRPTMTGRYGNEQEGALKRRLEIAESVRFDRAH
jgi:integrase